MSTAIQGFEEWEHESYLKDLESELRVAKELLRIKSDALTRMTMLAIAGWMTVLFVLVLLIIK